MRVLLVILLALVGISLRQTLQPTRHPPPVPNPLPAIPPRAAIADICGRGKVPLDPNDPQAAFRYIDAMARHTTDRWQQALLDSDDYRARATGLFLESRAIGTGAQPMADQARDALVQLAVGAGDPAVYAIALYACDVSAASPRSGACPQISLQAWAEMDSANAVPWLLLAGEARKRNDAAAEDDAFAHAAAAGKIDAYNFSLYAYAETELPSDATPLERQYFAIELLGVESATGMPYYNAASKHCSAVATQDSNLQRQCSALAELLVNKGTTLLDLGKGASLGARAGWPADRVAALTEERDALLQAGMQSTSGNNGELWSCDTVRRANAYMAEWSLHGEAGAARDSLERSGESVHELARKHRDLLERLRRDAQAPEAASPP